MEVTTSNGSRHRWLVVPDQISKATTIAFVRVFIGVFWLFEVTVGHNWKLGGFGSGTNPGWVGPGAGDAVRESIGSAVEDGTWHWVALLYENAIEPNAALFSYLVIALQVALGVFFIFGFLVRPMALLALTFDLSVLFLGNSRIPPFFSAAHLFVLATGAGMYYGADGWLWVRLDSARGAAARTLRWLIDVPVFKRTWLQPALLSGTALLALYFFMQMVTRPTPRMNMVSLELAFLFGIVAVGLHFGRLATDRLAVVVALLRVFVGFKFLHEIWVRTEPGVNALPGWASTDQLRGVFETISENHWAPFAWVVDTAVLPAITFWAIVFGIVQFAVGVALVVGWRTRFASVIGLAYLGGLGVLGFTRYAPFAYGLLIAVLALDGGRVLSLDSRKALARKARFGLPIPRPAVLAFIVIAAANSVAASIAVFSSGGIAPDGYTESMGQMTTAMVAIFSGMFALMGWLGLRSGGVEPTPETEAHSGSEWFKELASA